MAHITEKGSLETVLIQKAPSISNPFLWALYSYDPKTWSEFNFELLAVFSKDKWVYSCTHSAQLIIEKGSWHDRTENLSRCTSNYWTFYYSSVCCPILSIFSSYIQITHINILVSFTLHLHGVVISMFSLNSCAWVWSQTMQSALTLLICSSIWFSQ